MQVTEAAILCLCSVTNQDLAGLAQGCIYLRGDRSAAEVKEVVDAWLLAQQTQQPERGFWQGATSVVREVGSEILHLLFYMPASEAEKLHAVLADMWTGDRETARHTFELMHSTTALTALEAMLSEQGLDPDHFTLSTAWLGKRIYVSLQKGDHSLAAPFRLSVPLACVLTS